MRDRLKADSRRSCDRQPLSALTSLSSKPSDYPHLAKVGRSPKFNELLPAKELQTQRFRGRADRGPLGSFLVAKPA